MAHQARNVGILFADICESMRLYEALGNPGALAAIERCLKVIAEVVAAHGGYVVKTIGDEVMACFPDASSTWKAALAAQRSIDGLPPLQVAEGQIKLGLRIGLDYGQAIETNGDFFGGTVNMAARMVQLAKRGQIVATGEGHGLLPPDHGFSTREFDWMPVKGRPDGIRVVEVMWNQDLTGRSTVITGLTPASASASRDRLSGLSLELGTSLRTFDARSSRISVGREDINDLVVPNTSASRHHATIERRRDRWFLVDHSSNGTFVRSRDDGDVHLRHEELMLGREGLIGFGFAIDAAIPDCVSFRITQAS